MTEFLNCAWTWVGDNAAELIALSALFIAAYQGWSTRRHQRLSVRPYLAIHELYQRDSPQILLTLKNEGIGPAIIESYSIFLDGEEVDTTDKNCIVNICRELNVGGDDGGGSVIDAGEALSAGYSLPLLRIKTSDDFDPDFDNEKAHSAIERVELRIKYTSLYGQKFSAGLNNT